jgi:hypothetical protein
MGGYIKSELRLIGGHEGQLIVNGVAVSGIGINDIRK